jgi:glycosyltransferase involved in cell wall biosynthesis
MRVCILIPHYRHEYLVAQVLRKVSEYSLPIIVVDDGSPAESFAQLQQAVSAAANAQLDRLPRNRGKGAAIARGLQLAAGQGFTHAVQVDADGQHAISDIAVLLKLSRAQPEALVSGKPVYDATVPSVRLKGRQISIFWAQVNTWSRDIVDPMCGLRVYPVHRTLRLIGGRKLWMRMEFDTEILVRAHWAGVPLRFVPVSVTYPANGVSHFRMLRDNVLISGMHTRLFFGMLLRAPLLLARRLRRAHCA